MTRHPTPPPPQNPRTGAALVVALWVILILSMVIGSLAYEMHIEAGITSYSRKRLKAQAAARGGIQYARFLLAHSFDPNHEKLADETAEARRILEKNLSRGIGVSSYPLPLGDSSATIQILPEAGRRNVNTLEDADWEEILDQSGIPEEIWPDLIDCFMDFTDAGDTHRLNGAEKDDPFYEKAGYAPKNAALDTIDELTLIKHFTPEIVYGGRPPDADPSTPPYPGIARLLTTWGDGKVNINTASRDVLLTLTTSSGGLIDEWVVDDLLAARLGDDGIPNTEDDGFDSVGEAIRQAGLDPSLASKISISDRKYVRVTSIGQNHGVKSGIWAVFEVSKAHVLPIYWREENMH